MEDNEINQQVACELLEGMDIQVTVAGDGQQAIDMLQEESFDVVLMDIQMPVMDGYEATRRLRRDPRFASLPIIAMTAHAMSGDRELCLAAGMNDHLAKPIDPLALSRALSEHLQATDRSAARADDTLELPALVSFDVPAGLARVNGNRRLFKKLLLRFREDFRHTGEALGSALPSDPAQAQALTHVLKGVAGNLGAMQLWSTCDELEAACAHDRGATETLLKPVLEHLQSALSELDDLQPDESETPSATLSAEELREALARLKSALEDGDAQGEELLAPLRSSLAQSDRAKDLALLERQLEDFELDEAAETVGLLMDAL